MVRIGRRLIRGLIDTGSMTTILHQRIANKLKLNFKSVTGPRTLFSANGTSIPVLAMADVVMSFSGLQVPHTVKIVRDLEFDLIIGADFLSQNEVIIDYKAKLVSIGDDMVRVPLQSTCQGQNTAVAVRTICVPAFSEMLVPLEIPRAHNNKTVLLEPLPSFQFQNFAVARSLSKCENGKSVCKILNYNPKTLILKRKTKIASIESIENVTSCSPYNEEW